LEEVPPGLTPHEAIRRLRDQGAFISVSHPFDTTRSLSIYAREFTRDLQPDFTRCLHPGFTTECDDLMKAFTRTLVAGSGLG
jgi:hypothetical protein